MNVTRSPGTDGTLQVVRDAGIVGPGRKRAIERRGEGRRRIRISFLRVGFGGGYRFISGADLEKVNVSDGDLGASYGQLSLRFGSSQPATPQAGDSCPLPVS